MAIVRTIILKEVRQSDQVIFSNVLPVLSSRTNLQWEIVSDDFGDVAIVDSDTMLGRLVADGFEKKGIKTIRIATKVDDVNSGAWLRKPIRPADVIKHLASLKLTHVATLVRWPGKDVIQACLGSSRLCSIFFRRSISIEKATEISRLPRDQVLLFIEKCIESNCMKISNEKDGSYPGGSMPGTKNTSLFSRLRRKLYSRS